MRTVTVAMKVEAKEEIKTPAGTFQTIRVQPTADEGIVKNRGEHLDLVHGRCAAYSGADAGAAVLGNDYVSSAVHRGEMNQRERAVICLSGGMDSCVCAALAAREYEVYALHFSYGQRTEARELASAEAIARLVGVKELLPLRMDLFRRIGGSALTDMTIAVPEASADEAQIGAEVPVTYVPFRNAHFLSAAVSWAEVLGAKVVMIGAVEQDSSGYPDCRPAYYEAFNELVRQGTKEGDIRVETPLIGMRKSEIVRLGVDWAHRSM